ncbi:hypothetical protein F350042L8_34140 [Fusobacterium ulcerans]|uniref:hypothetical protein n=1 Tax=Fusobacterium ulcerans TaxID=861 RepID=UPI0034B6F9FB
MKKVLIGLMLLSLLVGCGGIKKYSQHEKDDLIIEVYDFGDEVVNTKAKAKLDKIMGDLEKEAAKGNKEAAAELEEWKVLTPEFRAKQIKNKANTRDGKW